MSETVTLRWRDDPTDFTPKRRGCRFVAEMPGPVASLDIVAGEPVVTLVGGATFALGGFLDAEDAASKAQKH